MAKKINFYRQLDSMDCGPTVIRMIVSFYGVNYSIDYIREITHVGKTGVSFLDLSKAAERIGFRCSGGLFSIELLHSMVQLPCILHWNQNHFVILYKMTHTKGKTTFYVADPGKGLIKYTEDEFLKNWISSSYENEDVGAVLLLEPTSKLSNYSDDHLDRNQKSIGKIKVLSKYLAKHKKFFIQLTLGLLIGSIIQLIFPFLTQSIVDHGIAYKNLNFIYLVLTAQFMLIISRTAIDFIRRRILLHVSTRINIALVSDFFIKLMNLPMNFFEKKLLGDILQRIEDHRRVEKFLTVQTLNLIFSFFSFIVFSIVLLIYKVEIFIVFLLCSVLYGIWLTFFLSKRKSLDYMRFEQQAVNQNKTYQLIHGMQEIKLQGLEQTKRWEWEDTQADLFLINHKTLSLQQLQEAGGIFINESKNIIITVLAAIFVIKGELTLGMMLSIQYIIGQLNSPVTQLVNFLYEWQDVSISLDRINEIHLKKNENVDRNFQYESKKYDNTITIKNLSFRYPGANSKNIIENLNLRLPSGTVTAIVGASGSGKTTLIKLLLGYYKPLEGDILIGEIPLNKINLSWWRTQCGVVMQDGFIFSNTIAENIASSDKNIDIEKLRHACKMANIADFIEKLPLKYNTVIGQEGQGLSQGQRQRLLISRAVYKEPEFLFLDEATNALDANNEKYIVENMDKFYKNRTVIIVAHRLSTVKNADQIIVLDCGKIVERGNHDELTKLKGRYYELVKNQLELGG